MKFNVPAADLLKVLKRVRSVVEKRNTIPVLSHFRLSASLGELVIVGSDLDMEMTSRIKADTPVAGASCVPADLFTGIVAKLPAGAEIHFEQSGPGEPATIRAGRARFSLQTLPSGDFPDMQGPEDGLQFSALCASLTGLITNTDFAISTEETRYYLNGIFLHAPRDGTLRGVATDGHRLAWHELYIDGLPANMPGVILPRKAAAEWRGLCDEAKGARADIAVTTQKISLSIGDTTLVSKLIDGTFPDYTRVVPTANPHKISCDAQALRAAVGLVAAMSSARGNAVKLEFNPDLLPPGTLRLSVTNPDAGASETEIEVDYDGPAVTIGFNATYLDTIVERLAGDKITFEIADGGSPTLIKAPDAESTLGVLMPMRV